MIGDVAQLPPVVREEDKEALFAEYRSPWFFSAKSFAAVSWEKHELTTIFRQDDPHFVSLLNKIRVGEAREAVAWINENCQTTLARGTILVPTNKSAEKINLQQLDKLGGGTQTFRAAITGDFPENHYPTEPLVSLCVGARVMIVKNIYRKKEDSLSGEPVVELALVNGDTGLVLAVDRMSIRFRCDRTEEEYTVSTLDGHWEKKEKRDVEKIERVFDPVLQKEVDKAFVISEDVVVGSFEQLPVRLAWAITIHKAQGATLHEATIDFRRPMFADGQSYVALSRASSSKRLWVLGKMREKDVILSAEAQDFLEHGLESRYIYQPPSAQEVERVVQGALL
jgi:ATP-dependent DNA helicase PIF1